MYKLISLIIGLLAAGICSSAAGQGSLPLNHLKITSSYGYRQHPLSGQYAWHRGIDLRAKQDTVYAVMPGVVERIGFDQSPGLFIILNHGQIKSTYGHLSQLLVFPGDSVSSGDAIAITGRSGRVTAEHLHFSIRLRGQPVDPLKFLYQLFNN